MEVVWRGELGRAEALRRAIAPDDSEDFSITVIQVGESAKLVVGIESESLGSLKASIDDVLACLTAADASLDSV